MTKAALTIRFSNNSYGNNNYNNKWSKATKALYDNNEPKLCHVCDSLFVFTQ